MAGFWEFCAKAADVFTILWSLLCGPVAYVFRWGWEAYYKSPWWGEPGRLYFDTKFQKLHHVLDKEVAKLAAEKHENMRAEDTAANERATAAEERAGREIAAARADAEERAGREISAARADAEERAGREIAAARADAHERAGREIAAARADAHERAGRKIAAARADANERAGREIAAARADAGDRVAAANQHAEAAHQRADTRIEKVQDKANKRVPRAFEGVPEAAPAAPAAPMKLLGPAAVARMAAAADTATKAKVQHRPRAKSN
ncbi:MAG: hypothetical protein M1815_003694 [Lichina confinis]|nr:MAG: hypothetical protein M1815_003694 [Lichina confinis]